MTFVWLKELWYHHPKGCWNWCSFVVKFVASAFEALRGCWNWCYVHTFKLKFDVCCFVGYTCVSRLSISGLWSFYIVDNPHKSAEGWCCLGCLGLAHKRAWGRVFPWCNYMARGIQYEAPCEANHSPIYNKVSSSMCNSWSYAYHLCPTYVLNVICSMPKHVMYMVDVCVLWFPHICEFILLECICYLLS